MRSHRWVGGVLIVICFGWMLFQSSSIGRAQQPPPAVSREAVDASVVEQMQQLQNPGMAVEFVRGDRIEYA